MKPMEIQEICQKAGARLCDGEGKERIHSVVTDSRKVEPGSLFIALKGERTDGHEYLEQALSQGAAAVMGRRTIWELTPCAVQLKKQSWRSSIRVPHWKSWLGSTAVNLNCPSSASRGALAKLLAKI